MAPVLGVPWQSSPTSSHCLLSSFGTSARLLPLSMSKTEPRFSLPCIFPCLPIRMNGPWAGNQTKTQHLTRNIHCLSLLVPPSNLPARLLKSTMSSKSPFSHCRSAPRRAIYLSSISALSRLFSWSALQIRPSGLPNFKLNHITFASNFLVLSQHVGTTPVASRDLTILLLSEPMPSPPHATLPSLLLCLEHTDSDLPLYSRACLEHFSSTSSWES